MARKATPGSFKKGDSRCGRPKGSKNRVSEKVKERLANTPDDPVNVLVECIRHGRETEDYELMQKAAANLAGYVWPRLRYSTVDLDMGSMPSVVVQMVKPEDAV